MGNKDLHRLKGMLAETKRTDKWLAEQSGRDRATMAECLELPGTNKGNVGEKPRKSISCAKLLHMLPVILQITNVN